MKKIMFNDRYGLEQAVLEGRKSMTRRVINIPDKWRGIDVWGAAPDLSNQTLLLFDGDGYIMEDSEIGKTGQILPTYKNGEVVAVAQSYKDLGYPANTIQRGRCVRAGNHPGFVWDESDKGQLGDWFIDQLEGWGNKMFVHPNMCKNQIRITNTTVERLRDISSEDCLKEGIEARITGYHTFYYIHGEDRPYNFPKQAFAALIEKISGKGIWEKNPWTFAYEFELVK